MKIKGGGGGAAETESDMRKKCKRKKGSENREEGQSEMGTRPSGPIMSAV